MAEISPRLRWACRRGMLELDVLLIHFLEEVYPSLSDEQQQIFQQLLECQDQDLFEWFTHKKEVPEPELKLMVEMILKHARDRH